MSGHVLHRSDCRIGGSAVASYPRGSVDRNFDVVAKGLTYTLSLPARERGSKPGRHDAGAVSFAGRSPRGSVDRNQEDMTRAQSALQVAPRAGAWIETFKPPPKSIQLAPA